MSQNLRTDLALERLNFAHQSYGQGRGLPGVSHHRKSICGIRVHAMTVETEEAAKMLCKPIGNYYTISLKKMLKRCDDGFIDGAKCVGEVFRQMLHPGGKYLIACLGNPRITPDAIGPMCAKHIMVTRHLKAYMPDTFQDFSEVALICPGVLGTTGIESAAIVKGAVDAIHPDAVIVIDALAAGGLDRLCSTIQICDTGIEPGSGVGNRRFALNKDTLGVPVYSAGIPTVVDASTLIADMTGEHCKAMRYSESMMVTPREIDSFVSDSAKLLAYGINFALHDELTLEDIDLFVS